MQASPFPLSFPHMVVGRVWLLSNDPDEQIANAAKQLFEAKAMKLGSDYYFHLCPFLSHEDEGFRRACSAALASAIQLHPSTQIQTIQALIQAFLRASDEIVPSENLRDEPKIISHSSTRHGVCLTLLACIPFLSPADIEAIFSFLLSHALMDPDESVWEDVLRVGFRMIDSYGAQHIEVMLPLLETVLTSPPKHPKPEIEDRAREGFILFLGRLARYLRVDHPKIHTIVEALIQILQTPSHSVQNAVAESLAALMPAYDKHQDVGALISYLFRELSHQRYAIRKGAA